MYSCSKFLAPAARTVVNSGRNAARPLSSTVTCRSRDEAALNASPINSLATYSGLSGLQATNQTPLVSMLNTQVSGAGIGSVFGSLVIGYARNPSLKQQLFSYAILGFALSEAMGLFCLMMAFLILFAF
ncbi:hypothetical protein LSH36_353g09051 [Paralvinella palmiformis]|uniref:ATPase protein 9 n=1 Tax=Paralvinella palmiformis TaxID=53620 RepID=A0AAD9JEY5_9ANNE|nr:hypothetical protein LSH36_353g09051 [Paralvinella palmiformis]